MDVSKNTWILIISLCWWWLPVSAQQPAGSSAATEKIHLRGHFSLVQLTETVYRQTGMGFSFNAQKIKGTKEMIFISGTYTLQQVLQRIHAMAGLNYVVHGDHIILYEPPAKATVKAVKKKQLTVALARKKPVQEAPAFHTIPWSESEIIITQAAVDTSFISAPVPPASVTAILQKISTPAAASSVITDIAQAEVPEKNLFSEGIYVVGGAFATDVLYANVGLEAGRSWLHLLASYGKNNDLHEWRIGLGSIVKRTPHASWEANASIGFMQRGYVADSGGFVKKNVQVKGQLADLQLGWWHVFNKRLATKAALNYHLLFSTYYIEGEKLPLNRLVRADYDNVYNLMTPWRLIGNTFDPAKATNLRQWIGGTIGIYYRIF